MTRNDPLEAQLEMLFSDAVLPDISGTAVGMAATAIVPTFEEILEPPATQPAVRPGKQRMLPWLLVSLAVVAAISIPAILRFERPGQFTPDDASASHTSEVAVDGRQAVSTDSSAPTTAVDFVSAQGVGQTGTEAAHTKRDQPTPTPGAFVLPNSASVAESTPTQIPSLTPSWEPSPTPTPEARPTHTTRPSATPALESSLTVTAATSPARTHTPEPEPTDIPRPSRASALSNARSAYPGRLVIPAIDLDAPIERVGYTNILINGQRAVTWAVPNSFAAGWHHTSAPLGQRGNTVLNGHESVRGGVFRDLIGLRPDDEIIVYAGAMPYRYRVSERHRLAEEGQPLTVRASNARWIMPTDDERLTLVTCAPHAESTHRLIVVALPAQ